MKAKLTAKGIINTLSEKKIDGPIIDKRLNEINRDTGPYFETEEEFRTVVKESFTKKDVSFYNWEPATAALDRFTAFMNELKDKTKYTNKTIGIVSHGSIMSLYFANIGGYIDDADVLYQKWLKTTFCGWGVIENETIIRELS